MPVLEYSSRAPVAVVKRVTRLFVCPPEESGGLIWSDRGQNVWRDGIDVGGGGERKQLVGKAEGDRLG